MEEITEEQRKRIEANRLAALAKRKAHSEATATAPTRHLIRQQDVWNLFKCRKFSPDHTAKNYQTPKQPISVDPSPKPHASPLPEKFRVRLEICSPDTFAVTPESQQDFPYPGDASCLDKIKDCLSNVQLSHYTQNHYGEKSCVYKLGDYDEVLKCLKNFKDVQYDEIPWGTYNVVERLSHSYTAQQWIPCRPEHLPDEKVDELIENIPKSMLDVLLPFQLEGVRFGLRRGGHCLIADEMGLGKTLQAIAIASCFWSEGCILVVCPAILRYSWAEEFERWLPFCLPADIHLVFGHQNNPAHLTRCPRVVVISYTMLHRLRKSMLEREWAVLIVDESHHVRSTKKSTESEEIQAVLDVATKAKHKVLLSGTPSLSRPYDIFHQINMLWPGLLGKNKYEFAKTYCSVKYVRGAQGKTYQDFSKGIRLEELNVLLKQTVMIRRLKQHVMVQLPPKRRQIISLNLKRSDIISAIEAVGSKTNDNASAESNLVDGPSDISDDCDENDSSPGSSRKLSVEMIGIAKLFGFREWLSIHPILSQLDSEDNLETTPASHKMIIFAHHYSVLDRLQEMISEKEIGYICIDGRTCPRDRHLGIQAFQSSKEVKVAIIGILAGGSGLNLSAAQSVVFLELPQKSGHMLQAEDRAHRHGQTKAVNIYIFCAKDTSDESHWQNLNRSLHRVSSTMNGKYDSVQEIEIERVSYFAKTENLDVKSDDVIVDRPSSTECFAVEPAVQDCDKTVEKADRRNEQLSSVTVTVNCIPQNNLYPEADVVSDLEMGDCRAGNGELDQNASEAESEGTRRISSHNLVVVCENEDKFDKASDICSETTELKDGGCIELTEAVAINSIEIKSLRFEVSQYTGRIHLYSCNPLIDSRPRPLFENFRQEEVESCHHVFDQSKQLNYKCIKDDPSYRNVLLTFVRQWNSLRPIEKKNLLGKPLQLPLSIELSCLNERLNHDSGGLLRGGSKRRTTPWHDISHPLPSNAVWKKVHLRNGCGKKEKEYTQGWTIDNEPLCKLCQTLCMSSNAKVPEFLEDLFCNMGCYEEYRLRTSKKSLREELFQIEHGICTNCNLDCHKLVKHIRPLSDVKRQDYIKKIAPKLAKNKKLLDKLVHDPTEGNAWHADHIIPVYRGGGECRLENMRTLCVTCHADVTAAQCVERRVIRRKAKEQLKVAMVELGNVQNAEEHVAKQEGQGQPEIHENIMVDELLIEVPGSAYSSKIS